MGATEWKRVGEKNTDKKWAHVGEESKVSDRLDQFIDIYDVKQDDFLPSLECFSYGNERAGKMMWAAMKMQYCLAGIMKECTDSMSEGYIDRAFVKQEMAEIFVYLEVMCEVLEDDVTDVIDDATRILKNDTDALR